MTTDQRKPLLALPAPYLNETPPLTRFSLKTLPKVAYFGTPFSLC